MLQFPIAAHVKKIDLCMSTYLMSTQSDQCCLQSNKNCFTRDIEFDVVQSLDKRKLLSLRCVSGFIFKQYLCNENRFRLKT